MATRLYDYQRQMRDSALEALATHNAVMCQMPTGTGKTHVLAAIVNKFARSSAREPRPLIWVVAHRRELIQQIQHTWDDLYRNSPAAPQIKVTSIQWLAKNRHKDLGPPPAMIVIDEAHHALADTYLDLFRRYPQAKKLGMTATPCRLNGKGFSHIFQTLLQSKSIPEFIALNRLSLFDYYALPPDSKIRRQIALLKKRAPDGDYLAGELELTLNTPRHLEYLYNSLMRYAPGRRGIVYAINIRHARAIAAHYASKGLRCVAIDCATPARQRDDAVESFRAGSLDVIVNVDIFSEGFDCPEVQFIQLARPTLSLAVYLQQIGRGLRKAKGKKYCVILDNAGLSHTFGTPIRHWDWNEIFLGKAPNPRIDAGHARALLSRLGHPGSLPDEPMQLAISHSEMNLAIDRQQILRYYPGSKLAGIILAGKEVARLDISSVISHKNDIAAVRLTDQSARIVLPSGRIVPLRPDATDFDPTSDNILKITTAASSYFIDLITNREFPVKPKLEKYGPIEFIGDGTRVWRRTPPSTFDYDSSHIGKTSWQGFYLKTFGLCPIATKTFIPRAQLGSIVKGDYSDVVLFADDAREYFLIDELPNRSIIVVDYNLNYTLVSPDLTRRHLFTSGSYASSKARVETLIAKYTRR